ncbi:MAG: HEPN domain-containing protein [Dethiobacter sp.]|jgi:HEPN domain-containing protein|nr:HEPN domain-containing protein [Dethiobacter sp.]
MQNNAAKEGLRWLAQSQSDLDDARYLFEGGRYNTCCFFCQQAAEKAIKAYLYQQGAEHVYGHSVAELCREAARLDQAFADIKTAVSPLDVYYIPTRYPNGLPGGIPSEAFAREDAERALVMAGKTITLVIKIMA